MRLVRLECRDFAMHARLDLDLSGITEAVIVGENGHGKSRLLDAVLWSVYGRPARGSTDRLIRRGAQSMSVATTWERNGSEVRILRLRSTATKGGSSSLSLTVDGETRTKHTIGETQAEIERLFGPLTTLWAGPIMAQGESDALMAADPKERKQVLGKLFGLDAFEAYHERAKQVYGRYVAEAQVIVRLVEEAETYIVENDEVRGWLDQHRIEAAEAERRVAEAEASVIALRERAVQVQERSERIVALSDQIDAANASIDQHVARRAALDVQLAEARNRLETPLAEPAGVVTEQQLIEARLLLAEERSLRSDRAVLGAKINQLKEALVRAEQDGLCDRCPYRVDTGEYPALEAACIAADNRLGELGDVASRLARLEEMDRARQAFLVALQRREDAEVMAAGLKNMLDDLARAEAREAERVQTLNAERTRLMQDVVSSDGLANELRRAAEELEIRKADLRSQRDSIVRCEAIVARLDDYAGRIVALTDQAIEIGTKVRAAEAVARAFHRDGIPTLVLEAGIPQIEARANAILDRMPGDLRLVLVTQRDTKSGGVRDTLDVVVQTEGVDCDYELLSGAERFRVDFALRLGLADVLSHRAGTSFETLWLDEPFSAQSPRALETLLECLSAVADDFGLVVVVTHQPEVADRFPVRLEVQKVDGIATVEVAA